jgi:uncharacterized protein YecE (DUF72 family)
MAIIVGTAGWSIPGSLASAFPAEGSALQRYATRFSGVEINSSFHRPHRRETWARWAESVPADFRFAVKIPKTISHERKLVGCADLLVPFLAETSGLGAKLALLLLQLPPKLTFDSPTAEDFLAHLTSRTAARIVCEPRHESWFGDQAEDLFVRLEVARVAADPAVVPGADQPGGWPGLLYWRLHGSPIMYRSSYEEDRLAGYADRLRQAGEAGREAWCMFDNTASAAATNDALALLARL